MVPGRLFMLRLNRLTDYAIVVLGALAYRRGDVMPTAQLATLTGLNQPTVAKVAKLLQGAGLLETRRGASGAAAAGRRANSASGPARRRSSRRPATAGGRGPPGTRPRRPRTCGRTRATARGTRRRTRRPASRQRRCNRCWREKTKK